MLNRYSSLAALIALSSSPGFALLLGDRQIAWLAGFLAVIVILKHHANVRRLLTGQESKISLGKRTK